MSLILCLETTTTNCSVALALDGTPVALKEDYNTSYSHGERLHLYVKDVLAEVGIAAAQLDAIAVSKGPGSYTGLRIGVSCAKGLCFSLDKPLLAIPTLKALASQIKANTGLIIPMLDARRMEVYSAVFDAKGKQLRETQAQILEPNAFADFLKKGSVHFIGNGVAKFQEICTHPNAIFHPGKLPSAGGMCAFAKARFDAARFEDLAYFEPYYLKDFIAGTPKK